MTRFRRRPQLAMVEIVKQPHRLRRATGLQADGPSGPVGMGWARAIEQHRLIRPRPRVEQLRTAVSAPALGVLGVQRAPPVDVAEDDRFRLDAEMLRDRALFVSGLLIEKTGGPTEILPIPNNS